VDEAESVVRASALLSGASQNAVEKVAAIARLRRYARGATLFLQGERANAIGIVAQGWMKLFRLSSNGVEVVVRVFGNGESFGEAVALRNAPYPVSAAAVTECSIVWLDAERLLALLREDPEIAVSLLSSTFIHLHELVNQVEQLKSHNGAQRVAAFLVGLCSAERGSDTVNLPYDKMLIAAQLGIKPESLSRAFARLRGLGVTIKQGAADIADVAALAAFATEDPGLSWSRRDQAEA